ncbi:hypothetical protein TWF506_006135 [Arthrobotrys conoides]|uniref:Aminoglycoside phosphotransferase domain-containing protein n=1 Tax=Arthrobotrys conoides TaxID=74498 RepID=A0AAN8S0B2_9PEZI
MSSPLKRRDLALTVDILDNLFGKIQPECLNILAQTFDTCTFGAHFATVSKYGVQDLLVRLELTKGRLEQVAAMQRLAFFGIPRFVPRVFEVGSLTTYSGQEVEFSITEYITGTVTLESVWQDLEDRQQAALMDSVVGAMKKLQALRLDNKAVKKILSKAFLSQEHGSLNPTIAGGPNLGCLESAVDFFSAIIKTNNPKSQSSAIRPSQSDTGIVITSEYIDIGQVQIPAYILRDLQDRFVFCHNDLEPRNILVRNASTKRKTNSYELVAIIDWEMSGFYPFAYEYSLKDHILGSSNLYFSWYSLFKSRTRCLLPAHKSTEAIIQAVDIIMSSRKRRMTKNVGVLLREKFLIRENLVKGEELAGGWVRQADAGDTIQYTKQDNDELLENVLKGLGRLL